MAPRGFDISSTDYEELAELARQAQLASAKREATIRDLLTHTFGRFNITGVPGIGGLARPVNRRAGETLADFVPRLGGAGRPAC